MTRAISRSASDSAAKCARSAGVIGDAMESRPSLRQDDTVGTVTPEAVTFSSSSVTAQGEKIHRDMSNDGTNSKASKRRRAKGRGERSARAQAQGATLKHEDRRYARRHAATVGVSCPLLLAGLMALQDSQRRPHIPQALLRGQDLPALCASNAHTH